MPRIAIGDLTIDIDVPERFTCEYMADGSFTADSPETGESFEITNSYMLGTPGADIVRKRVNLHGFTLLESREGFALSQETECVSVGISDMIFDATNTGEKPTDLVSILATAAWAIDPDTQYSPLRSSHTRFFDQRRDVLAQFNARADQPHAVDGLSYLWLSLLMDPPEKDHMDWTYSVFVVGLGDLLCQRGYEWFIDRENGYAYRTVGIRSGAVFMPLRLENFIENRWDKSEPLYVDAFFKMLDEALEERIAEWKKNAS